MRLVSVHSFKLTQFGKGDDILVQAQLGSWISSLGGAENDVKEGVVSKDGGENGGTHGTVVVEDLVGDIPRLNLSLVSSSNLGNVVLDDSGQSRLVVDVLNPVRIDIILDLALHIHQ